MGKSLEKMGRKREGKGGKGRGHPAPQKIFLPRTAPVYTLVVCCAVTEPL